MKVGDKVRVTRLTMMDKKHTNLEVGGIGTVEHIQGCDDDDESSGVYYVNFGDGFLCKSVSVYFDFSTNNYAMYGDQVELVEDEK